VFYERPEEIPEKVSLLESKKIDDFATELTSVVGFNKILKPEKIEYEG
jgi:hypothetical protein